MQVFAPLYYNDFKCIADKCTHSCCIGWEIDIDEDTLRTYEEAIGEYHELIRASIDYTDAPHFKLSANDRCAHLDDRGLCKIITECGEDLLCDICREHPRFYNLNSRGLEVGIGMSCEEAARIILTSDAYANFTVVDKRDTNAPVRDFDTVAERERIYEILSDGAPYGQRLEKIYTAYGVSPKILSDEEWREEISALEYLEEGHRELFSAYTSDERTPPEYEKILERALAYFIYRHTGECADAEEFRASLGLACFMERLFASLVKTEGADAFLLGRIISEEIEYSEDNTENIKLIF